MNEQSLKLAKGFRTIIIIYNFIKLVFVPYFKECTTLYAKKFKKVDCSIPCDYLKTSSETSRLKNVRG